MGSDIVNYLKGASLTPQAVDDQGNSLPVSATFPTSTGLAVWGPDAAGAAPTRPPVLIGGVTAGGTVLTFGVDTANNLKAVGNVTAGATDSGNPVKVGGVYSTTLPTLTNGQRGNLQLGQRGSANVSIMAADAATPVRTTFAADGLTSSVGLAVLGQNLILGAGTNFDQQKAINVATGSSGVGVTAIARAGSAALFLNTNTTVKSGAGILDRILVNNAAAAATMFVWDNTTGTGTLLATIVFGVAAVGQNLEFGAAFNTGLTITFSGAVSVTAVYR